MGLTDTVQNAVRATVRTNLLHPASSALAINDYVAAVPVLCTPCPECDRVVTIAGTSPTYLPHSIRAGSDEMCPQTGESGEEAVKIAGKRWSKATHLMLNAAVPTFPRSSGRGAQRDKAIDQLTSQAALWTQGM